MKICLIGNFTTSYGQICDERHIANALKELGQEVHCIQREEFASRISELEKTNVDVTIFFKWPGFTSDQIVRWKKTTNSFVFAWTFDFMMFHPNCHEMLRAVDCWLGEELGLLVELERRGFRFHYFPNHAVPENIFKKIEAPKEYDIIFTGTYYPRGGRIDILSALSKLYKVDVFGNDYQHWAQHGVNGHPAVFDDKLPELIAKSKIVLGINVTNETWGYWSIRPAQIMMCGGFTIQKYIPGMEKELKDGCAYWHELPDLITQVKYYLEHENERNEIAKKGYEIAHRQNTSLERARELVVLLKEYPKFKYYNPV